MEFIIATVRVVHVTGSLLRRNIPLLAASFDSGTKAYFRKRTTIGTFWNDIPSFYKTINSTIYIILVLAFGPHTFAKGKSKVIAWVRHWAVFIVTVIIWGVVIVTAIIWLSFNVVEDVRLVGAGDHLGLGEMLVALDNELGLVVLLDNVRDVLGLGMPITPLATGISR